MSVKKTWYPLCNCLYYRRYNKTETTQEYHAMEKYSKFYYESKEKIAGYRLAIVDYAQKTSISCASRHYKTTRKTVRKWFNRYNGSLDSLEDHSKRPHSISNKLSDSEIEKIRAFCNPKKEKGKKITGTGLINDLKLRCSIPTANKYLKLLGFVKKKESRKKRKRNLSELKKNLRSFEKIQVDIKYLDDINEFYTEYFTYKLPKYQITARCVKTGSLFIGFALEKTNLNTAIFINRLLTHLRDNGIDTSETIIQTDNGTEFRNFKSNKSTMFIDTVSYFNAGYRHIPAGAKTWQSDVETSHRLIEDEFYAYEIFNSRGEFFRKAFDYVKRFNLERKNSYKENMTPAQILQEDIIHEQISFFEEDLFMIEDIYNFKPVISDYYTDVFLSFYRTKIKAG